MMDEHEAYLLSRPAFWPGQGAEDVAWRKAALRTIKRVCEDADRWRMAMIIAVVLNGIAGPYALAWFVHECKAPTPEAEVKP
jgi:hypothetical protein